jgi:hypothetical protein
VTDVQSQGGRAASTASPIANGETANDYPLGQWPEVAAQLERLLREWAESRLEAVPAQYKPTVRVKEVRVAFLRYLDETGQLMWPIPSGPGFDEALRRAMRSHDIERGGRGGGHYRGLRWRSVNADGNVSAGG